MKSIIIEFIKFYKKVFSPVLERLFGGGCRFTPTCSEYTIEALEKHGTLKGLTFGFKRVISCHPWGRHGFDPVPN